MHKNIHRKILFRGDMSEPFTKIPLISDEYKYLNIRIKCIRIKCIRAISGIEIYFIIPSVNMLHPSIFGYSFGS